MTPVNRLFVSTVLMVALSACVTAPREAAPSFANGARVLAEYQNTGLWWAGTVSGQGEGQFAIDFDDGTTDKVDPDELEPLLWRIGSSDVVCNGVPGRIVAYVPAARTVTIEDAGGAKIETGTGSCLENRGPE